jgi:dihydropteroate synthase
MGVLNATPDSFFDGGRYLEREAAVARVAHLVAQGARIIDIGGESSRPGSEPVDADTQIARIEPIVREVLATSRVLVSIDTTRPEVADRMLALGAHFVNDVSCLGDPDLARVTALHGAGLILMHSRGPMGKMPGYSRYPEQGYGDVVREVISEWSAARQRAVEQGLAREDIFFDPGIGFNKSARHSFEVLRRLEEFRELGAPIVVGPSRKSFISLVDDAPPEERLGGTIAACLSAAEHGAAILRVHDVRAVRQALAVARAIRVNLVAREAAHA